MPFTFLRYLQPTHYFQLFKTSGNSVFPKVSEVPSEILDQLQMDHGYISQLARHYDLSWQAVQAGYIGNARPYDEFEAVPLQDNYHFIRKQFHPAWVFYVLLLRVFTFKNPIAEVKAWLATSGIKKQHQVTKLIHHPEWATFNSVLLSKQPLVSVIIPTLNRYDYLKNILKDFEEQDYTNFEIIIVDQSEPFQPEFYRAYDLKIRILRQKERALWLARNSAIREAEGTLVALSEDDVRIQPNWLSSHVKCLDVFGAKVSAGVFYPEGQRIPTERSFFALASQFATGNALLYKSVFERVGLFDRQFEKQRMGDGEFGNRIYMAGILSVSNPYASCVDVKAGTGGLREMGSWDAFRPSTIFAPRPIPSVLYYFRTYYGNRAAIFALLKTVPISILPYQFKKNKPMLLLGAGLSIMLLPLVMIQVLRSWRLASVKLKEGPRIDKLTTTKE